MADLIADPQTDKDSRGDTDSQSGDIDKRIKLVLPQAAQGKAKIDLEHGL